MCKFCNRKCERLPHSDHNCHCDRVGHAPRVFGKSLMMMTDPQFTGLKYPSLKRCDLMEESDRIYTSDKKFYASKGEPRYEVTSLNWREANSYENSGWKLSFIMWKDAEQSDYCDAWKTNTEKFNNFWNVVKAQFCRQHDLAMISNLEEITDQYLSEVRLA